MKRWLPFIILIVVIFLLVNYLLFTGQKAEYTPESSDPSIVYKEACLRCHGERGEGGGLLYPDLLIENIDEEEILDIVRNGKLFMPSFPHIPDSTLSKLATYVSDKRFKNE
jgi:mono/diheme cytochrome c family protein